MAKKLALLLIVLCSCKSPENVKVPAPLTPSIPVIVPRHTSSTQDSALAVAGPPKQWYLVWTGGWSNYVVEYKTNLSVKNWSSLGTTTTNRWPLLFIDRQRFYRVGGF